MKRKPTYGEEWGRRKSELEKKIANLQIKLDLDEIDITRGLPKRMPRNEAAKYYTEKLRRYWRDAGYYKHKPYPPLQWIKHWIEKAYWRGYHDGQKERPCQ